MNIIEALHSDGCFNLYPHFEIHWIVIFKELLDRAFVDQELLADKNHSFEFSFSYIPANGCDPAAENLGHLCRREQLVFHFLPPNLHIM